MKIAVTKQGITEDILDNLPHYLKDDKTGSHTGSHGHYFYSLNDFCKFKVTQGARVPARRARLKVTQGSVWQTDFFKVQLILNGYTEGKNSKSTYVVDENGNISPNFLKRLTEHTLRHQKSRDAREAKAKQRLEDSKVLLAYVEELSKIKDLDTDSYSLQSLKSGHRDSVSFESEDNSLTFTLGTDCNGEVILASLAIDTRSIDLDTIKKVISIFGMTTYYPTPIQRSLPKRTDELFDTTMFN